MADNNIFDFESIKKQIEELAENQRKFAEEQKQPEESSKGSSEAQTPNFDFAKMMEAYSALGSLFARPSPEQMKKAADEFAEALEGAAKTIRSMHDVKKEAEETEDDS